MYKGDDVPIRVEHLTAKYEGRMVLDDLSFFVKKAEIFVILGGSGCGKSTLLKHIFGLYKPASGQIYVNGTDIVKAGEAERESILQQIGVAFQGGAMFGSLNLLENVRLPLKEFTDLPNDAIDRIAYTKLNLVGLGEFCYHMPSEISGGMLKRAALARAMALDPEIICLDEPSAGLDPITSADLDQLILNLARSLHITFLIVSHELASIYSIADRVIMLDVLTKKIVGFGPPAGLRDTSDNPWVRQFFNRQPSKKFAGKDVING